MPSDPIERLSSLFERFPGIGPRQAQRFVQFLLRSSPSIRREIIEGVRELGSRVHQCAECMRFSTSEKGLCEICSDLHRDKTLLAIVASDADLLALERSRTYRGKYFVLGGLISLASDKTNGLRIKELLSSIGKRTKAGLKEVILAFPANPEGDSTTIRVREELAVHGGVASVSRDKTTNHQGDTLMVTKLGRGLSTGSELEYADPDTLKSALDNRK